VNLWPANERSKASHDHFAGQASSTAWRTLSAGAKITIVQGGLVYQPGWHLYELFHPGRQETLLKRIEFVHTNMEVKPNVAEIQLESTCSLAKKSAF